MAVNSCITFAVNKSLQPFEQDDIDEARRIFSIHPHSEQFLDEKHEHMLPNYETLKNLGPHLLLAHQTVIPKRWIDLKLEARDKGHRHWITLTLREDNMYCRGFSNEHNAYELLAPSLGEGQQKPKKNMLPKLLPPNFLPLNWNVHYRTIFQCKTNKEVEVVLHGIAQNPDFVADGVCFLSKYQHREGSDEEATARRYLGGIIFLLIERLRMNMEVDFVGKLVDGRFINVTGLQKAQVWGIACGQLLTWREDGFIKWIETDNPKEMTNKEKAMIAAGLLSGEKGLRMVCLVLNRKEAHHSLLGTSKPKGPGNGGGSKDKGKGPKPKGPGKDGKGGSQGKGDDGKGGSQGKGDDRKGKGWDVAQDGDCPYYGRCRLQLLVSANFKIDGVNLYDWHRGQMIYRRSFINNTSSASSSLRDGEKLVLIGPERPIDPFGPLALQIFRTTEGRKRKRTTIQRNPILRSWNVPECDDDKPTVYHHSFEGVTHHEKVNISYMVIPNTTEARCEISLLLRDCNAGYDPRPRSRDYDVCGSVKVTSKQMECFSVELFSKERNTFKVSCGKKTQVPMFTLVCLPGEELDITVHFTLKPSMGKQEEIGPFVLNFNPSVKTQTHKCEGHTVEIAVNMSK